jgi:hypothetical protein
VLAVLPERLEKWEAIAFDESESELAIPEEYA